MSNWLQKYEYRVALSWWIFALAGLSAVVITLLTISYQTIRAALTNPVKSLRNE
jgi:ABC-type lipoprotein release transport system permease subunit